MAPSLPKKSNDTGEKSSVIGERSIGKGKSNQGTKNNLEYHQTKYKKLEEEYETLKEASNKSELTEEGENRMKELEENMEVYADTGAQANVTPTRSTEPMQTDDKPKNIKQEFEGESKPSTGELIDDLSMKWDIDLNDSYGESSLQNLPKDAFGHIVRNSRTRYCIRYGSQDARSARFESILPNGSNYTTQRDVTQGSNRIVEKIVQHHRDTRTSLPMNILSQVRILVVYWDSKMGVGHDAEVEVLAPNFEGRRPHTRCFIYLDPNSYSQYKLPNITGYSHETRSTIKLLLQGNNDRQKSIALHNIAVDLENKFEERWMSNIPGRPGPLQKLMNERKAVPRRNKSSSGTTELSANPTLSKPPVPPNQSTPLQKIPQEQTPVIVKPGIPLRERFHKDFLELFELAENTTYKEFPEELKLSYTAQFTKWKEVNS